VSAVRELIEGEGLTVEDVRIFLDELRESGEKNMYASGQDLEEHFGFDKRQARPIVTAYLRTGLRDI